MIRFTKKDLRKLNNVGDLLCTPDIYFDISSEKELTIVGGGVWNIEKLSASPESKQTILWGAGRSVRYPSKASSIGSLNFLAYGIRDILDLSDKSKFLPCVSCLNERIIQDPTSDKTLVFTNANSQVSPLVPKKDKSKIYLSNSCSENEFLEAWNQCDKIITNSYHGIYWSLLSGREVAPYGYSSKFTNVTGLFGINFPQENMYSVKTKTDVLKLLEKNQTFIKAKNHKSYLDKFRELNIDFAKKLEGVECKQKTM